MNIPIWSMLVIPAIIAGVGYVFFTLRKIIYSFLFVSVTIEEDGEFVLSLINVIKNFTYYQNWISGSDSLLGKSTDNLKINKMKEFFGLNFGLYLGNYNGKFFFVNLQEYQSQSQTWTSRHPIITFTTLRKNADIIFEILSKAKVKQIPQDCIITGNHWATIEGRNRFGFDNLFLANDVKEDIVNKVNWFNSDEGVNWHLKHGQAYKLVILLHGVSGSGKTAIAKAISDMTCRSLCYVRLSTNATDADFSYETTLRISYRPNSVILLDEIDKVFIENRDPNSKMVKMTPDSLLGILNGDFLNGQIIVMTANDLELIPVEFRSHLFRAKRVDATYYLGNPTEEQKKEACEYYNTEYNMKIKDAESMASVIEEILTQVVKMKEKNHETSSIPSNGRPCLTTSCL